MTYTFLLESVWHPPLAFAETVQRTLPLEMELQALWYSGAFGRDFRTLDGRPVRLVQFGEWNRGPGPDFRQVAIEIEGEVKTGDLELDSSAADWEWHRHGANESFREVVLHVSFQTEGRRVFIRTCDHREIPQVVISSTQLADALNRPQQEVAIALPGRCVAPLRHLPPGGVDRLLEEAAGHRAELKAGRYLRVEDVHGSNAALFQATAETLGYRGNSLAMRMLTQRVPLTTFGGDGNRTDAILFGAAGLLSAELHEKAPADTRDYLRDLWESWWRERTSYESTSARAIPWRCGGQRPANHPHRRIGTLAALVRKWPTYRKLALARPFQPRLLVEFLEELEHPFWSRRHTLTSAASASKIALFGRTQALELLANHLIPLALHDDALPFKEYYKLRSSSPNEKVKRCAIRLFGSMEAARPWLKRVCHHQALLQIYQDFCLEDFSDCANCPFPEQLSQWK